MAREIQSYIRLQNQMGLSEDLPDNFIRAVQFFTFLDLVCDGAESKVLQLHQPTEQQSLQLL